MDWGVIYYGYQEQDPNVIVCQWETVKIMNTVLHDETDMVVAAGRIYIDQDERFLEEIVKKVTSGRRRVHGKIHYRRALHLLVRVNKLSPNLAPPWALSIQMHKVLGLR